MLRRDFLSFIPFKRTFDLKRTNSTRANRNIKNQRFTRKRILHRQVFITLDFSKGNLETKLSNANPKNHWTSDIPKKWTFRYETEANLRIESSLRHPKEIYLNKRKSQNDKRKLEKNKIYLRTRRKKLKIYLRWKFQWVDETIEYYYYKSEKDEWRNKWKIYKNMWL